MQARGGAVLFQAPQEQFFDLRLHILVRLRGIERVNLLKLSVLHRYIAHQQWLISVLLLLPIARYVKGNLFSIAPLIAIEDRAKKWAFLVPHKGNQPVHVLAVARNFFHPVQRRARRKKIFLGLRLVLFPQADVRKIRVAPQRAR